MNVLHKIEVAGYEEEICSEGCKGHAVSNCVCAVCDAHLTKTGVNYTIYEYLKRGDFL
jgi:hypothetical protein